MKTFTLLFLLISAISIRAQNFQKWTKCLPGRCADVLMSASTDENWVKAKINEVPIEVSLGTNYHFSIEVKVYNKEDGTPTKAKKISVHARAGNGNVYYPQYPSEKTSAESHSIVISNNGPSWIQGGVIVEFNNGKTLKWDGNEIRIGI